jgi:ribosomal protein L11 methyltransferase
MSDHQPLQCVQVTLETPDPITRDIVEGALWEADFVSWELQDEETWSELVEDPRPRRPSTVRWRIHLQEPTNTADAQALVESMLAGVDGLTFESWEITDFSFLTAWKEFFRPAQVSERVMVCPPWDRREPVAGGIVVEIDPGMAFGTGTHETTRLCMRAIDRAMNPPLATVLDVGTGSGILAITAALMGATTVVGTDNDELVIPIAAENARINGVSHCQFSTRDLHELDTTFDLVLANILPHVLLELRDQLIAHTRPGGWLVLSGILGTEAARVEAGFSEALGCSGQHEIMGEWTAITYRRPA